MVPYQMHGSGLYNHNHRIAIARGNAIYDDESRSIATIVGNDVYDTGGRRMFTVRGSDIYDPGDKRIGSLMEARESIEGTLKNMPIAALWYCFIR